MATQGKVIRCRAAVAWEPNQPLSVEEIELDVPKKGEVRVRMVATSLCHSDLHALTGKSIPGMFDGNFPMVPGHEGAGVVESVGDGVTTLQEGDKVLACFMANCKKCNCCLAGLANLCELNYQASGLMQDGTSRMTCRGKKLYNLVGCSTFSEYCVTTEDFLAKIPPNSPLSSLSPMSCCVPTGVGAALNTAQVRPGSVCAVWGLGAVGLATVLGCKMAGATTIIGVDINDDKAALAKKFGCTDFVNPLKMDIPITDYFAMKFAGGCDFTFEAVGLVGTMKDAFKSCRPGNGKCIVIGVVPGGRFVELDPMDFLFSKTITGGLFGGYRSSEVHKLVDDVVKGKIDVEAFITNRIKLADINVAIEDMRASKGIRTVVDY